MPITRALPLLLLVACATTPPEPSAPYGTVAWAQQNYNAAVNDCQQRHDRMMSTMASMGQNPNAPDPSFNACMEQAKTNLDLSLRQAH
jgi:hypothetical protein